jgi:uncharacterized protein YoxC
LAQLEALSYSFPEMPRKTAEKLSTDGSRDQSKNIKHNVALQIAYHFTKKKKKRSIQNTDQHFNPMAHVTTACHPSLS